MKQVRRVRAAKAEHTIIHPTVGFAWLYLSYELAIVPIARAPLGMGDGNDVNSLLVMTKYNLERKLLHVARTVPRVDSNESFGIGLNVRDCDIYGNTKITSSVVTMLRVPTRRGLQFGRCFGMKTNSHRQHRAS